MIVDTLYGRVSGVDADGLAVFRGIPYAAPPVGPRRWLPPASPAGWDGVRPAVSFGPACPQGPSFQGPQSEDCLYLNVWTPACDDAKRAVMVWIHGGALAFGSSSEPAYDGRHLARRGDVVVVSMNYRMGALGFLRIPGVSTGNEGCLDVIAALEWVRDNIASFGGDPANVLLFGESAGAWITGALLAFPSARGLFHKCIPMSGTGYQALGVADAEALGSRVASCIDAGDLRAASPEQLFAVVPHQGKGHQANYVRMVIDGETMGASVFDAVRRGDAADVTLVVGTTRDEKGNETPCAPMSQDELRAKMAANVAREVDLDGMMASYEKARGARHASTDPRELAIAIKTDAYYRIPGIRLLDAQRPWNSAVYHYIFSWVSPIGDGAFGALHGVDFPFTFATHDTWDLGRRLSGQGPAADALAAAWQDALASFARTGDPSTSSLGPWPPYGDTRATMIVGERTEVVEAPYEDERLIWSQYSDETVTNGYLPGRTLG